MREISLNDLSESEGLGEDYSRATIDNPKVSIIIPTYFSEKYLRQCLDSVVNQTLKDIEIIIVDADSTDNTVSIIQEYLAKDNRIKFLHRAKEYLGASRNTALDYATGDYIMFLDSDDWYEDNACEIAYEQIKNNNNDFVYFNVYNYYEGRDIKELPDFRLKNLLPYKDNKNIKLWEIENFLSSAECWYKIYNRNFLNKNEIRFYADGFSEDINFYFKCVTCSTSVSVIEKPLINYRKVNSSASFTTYNTHWRDQFIVRAMAYETVLNSMHSQEYLKTFISYYINSIINWYYFWSNMKDFNGKAYYKKMQELFLMLKKNHSEIILANKKYMKNYKRFERISKESWAKYLLRSFVKKVFSIKNDTKEYKIVSIFGIEFRIKRKKKQKNKRKRSIYKTFFLRKLIKKHRSSKL